MSSNEPNEEHLSAYLDGELDGDALDRVEHQLQSDGELRRCYEDFRALRESIQQLPPHELGPEFSQRVLQCIAEKAAARSVAEVQVAERSVLARRGWPLWAMGAVAATLLLALVIPSLLPEQVNVAMDGADHRETAENNDAKTDVVVGEEKGLGKTPGLKSETAKSLDAPQPFNAATHEQVRQFSVPESPRGAVVDGLLAEEIREQDQSGATANELPAEQLRESADANYKVVGAGESRRAQSGARASPSDPLRDSESRPPERRLSYRKLDSSEKELDFYDVDGSSGGPSPPSYLVSLNKVTEQQLLDILKIQQQPLDDLARHSLAQEGLVERSAIRAKEDKDSQSQLPLADSSAVAESTAENQLSTAKQSLQRRVRRDVRRDFGYSGRVEGNRTSGFVVVDASIEEAADLLRTLDPLVSAQRVELIPISADTQSTNRFLEVGPSRQELRLNHQSAASRATSPVAPPVAPNSEPARDSLGRNTDRPAVDDREADALDVESAEPADANSDFARRKLSRSRSVEQPAAAAPVAGLELGSRDGAQERVRIVFAFDSVGSNGQSVPATNAHRSNREE